MIDQATLYALCGSVLIGVGLYGFVAQRHLLKRVIAFNVIGSGIFLLFGATGWRRPELGADPVPQALIITGIVVALSATALVVALIVCHATLSGRVVLREEAADEAADEPAGEAAGKPPPKGTD